MKRFIFILIFLALMAAVGCAREAQPEAQQIAVASPTAMNTVQPTAVPATVTPVAPTPEPAISPTAVVPEPSKPEVRVTPTPVEATAVPTIPAPTVTTGDDGKVYLDGKELLDIQAEAPACFPDIPADVSYSPTAEFFLVIPACIEQDNQAFLFKADGSGKTQITQPWGYLNTDYFDWSPDGQYLVYQRINSCCASEIPATAPQPGLVRYDVYEGEETVLVDQIGMAPSWSPDGEWIAFVGQPWSSIYVTNCDGSELWLLDTLSRDEFLSPALSWEFNEAEEALILWVDRWENERSYEISALSGDSPPGTLITSLQPADS